MKKNNYKLPKIKFNIDNLNATIALVILVAGFLAYVREMADNEAVILTLGFITGYFLFCAVYKKFK